MKVRHIVGADLSKDTVDLALHAGKSHLKIENSTKGFNHMLQWFKAQHLSTREVLLVMEHTGLYSYQLEGFLHQHQISFTKVPALAVKHSLGLVRGKNDKIDAQRLARYGTEKREVLLPTPKPTPALERLQMLHSTRERLVKLRSSLLCAVKQYGGIVVKTDVLMSAQYTLIGAFTDQIKTIEAEIQKVTEGDAGLKHNCDLLQSVTGVGPVLSAATLVKTKNFTAFTDPRKFGCYCGVAPFEHSSGKSIRGKTRVSHLADKRMKTLLDQAAKSAIQYDQELKAYYLRRLEMGKSRQSTINIVRNKILYRMFAVVKRGTPFVKDYPRAA